MAGLLIASFLCYAIGFIGPFAFFCKSPFLFHDFFQGIVCTFLTFTMNLFIDFVPTYSEKQSVVVNTDND